MKLCEECGKGVEKTSEWEGKQVCLECFNRLFREWQKNNPRAWGPKFKPTVREGIYSIIIVAVVLLIILIIFLVWK